MPAMLSIKCTKWKLGDACRLQHTTFGLHIKSIRKIEFAARFKLYVNHLLQIQHMSTFGDYNQNQQYSNPIDVIMQYTFMPVIQQPCIVPIQGVCYSIFKRVKTHPGSLSIIQWKFG